MIKNFVKAWDENNHLLLDDLKKESPEDYEDIVKKIVKIVINPYLESKNETILDIDNMTVIDDGEYQGTTIYIIPFDTYQPSVDDYVYTNNYYGSCSGCDTFKGIASDYSLWDDEEADKEGAAKEFHTLALHLLQSFRYLNKESEE